MAATGIATSARHASARVPARPVGLVLLTAAVAALVTYLVLDVPVGAPLPGGHLLWFCPLAAAPLPHTGAALSYAQIARYWGMALAGAGVVLAVDAIAILAAVRHRRRRAREAPAAGVGRGPLRLERVPARVAWITGSASLTLLVAGLAQGYAMWVTALMTLAPWLPLLVVETAWKYEHYGLWALFGVIVLLQVGHMGEHTVQVTQLLLYGGHLAQAHGVFGQLDFETVHFFWDSAIWLSLCFLLTRFPANRWLWVAFVAASLHQVEHLYLFWVYSAHPFLYVHGGLAGIMGYGGLIGSPLARPYLHFTYNFLVVVPMVLAFWDQTKHVHVRSGVAGWPTQPALAVAPGRPLP